MTSRSIGSLEEVGGKMIQVTYRWQVISATDNNCLAVVRNLDQAKTVLRRISHILARERATPWVSGFFFKVVIQAERLFGSDTWVVTPLMGTDLRGFQTQVSRHLKILILRRTTDRTWKYNSVTAEREAPGFLTI